MEYNQDAVRLVKPYVDDKVATGVASAVSQAGTAADAKIAVYIVTSATDPTNGTLGQLAVVAGTLKVCTVAYVPAEGETPAVPATWKAVSHA